ncbi:MAG: putative HMP/thiamine import ATP-binding protein YkoD [Syntrophorhabdaceae bacterium PtaU1.Bin034]|nr:MAG: putative HMP/thiamine import ATP-binding protein YkoD [Syntrophorhabdaceae bacterium PtaU1.Bin034]
MAASVSVESLSFAYRGAQDKALKNLEGRIDEGAFVAVMGRSGAGKSTLCCAMNGLVPRFFRGTYKGRVCIRGKEVAQCGIAELARMVGLVLQDFEAQLFSTNVELEVAFGPENQRLPRHVIKERIDRYLTFVGLSALRRRDVATLSGGQKQRLAIGSILAMEPDVLVMDEPVTDLDPTGREEILSVAGRLREEGRTLIVVDNEPENVARADQVWLMRDGEIVGQDAPSAIFRNVPLLEACGVMVPPLTLLFQALGWPGNPVTFDQGKRLIQTHGLAAGRRNNSLSGPLARSVTTRGSKPLIEARGVSFRYPRSTVDSLKEVSVTIGEGEFVAVLGQNGSGKTTLAKHFNGLLRPTSGMMLVNDKPTESYRKKDLARLVGYVFQNPDHQIFASTVYDEVGFGLKMLGETGKAAQESVAEALAATGLEGYEERSPFVLTRGERQRVAVASVLAVKPRVMVLDEPTTGLDYRHQLETMKMLKELNRNGSTIIIITHSMWIVESFTSRTIVMENGRVLADGATRAVFSDERTLSRASLVPSALTRLANWLDTASLSVEGMAKELRR